MIRCRVLKVKDLLKNHHENTYYVARYTRKCTVLSELQYVNIFSLTSLIIFSDPGWELQPPSPLGANIKTNNRMLLIFLLK